jgi:hypothetical protein
MAHLQQQWDESGSVVADSTQQQHPRTVVSVTVSLTLVVVAVAS